MRTFEIEESEDTEPILESDGTDNDSQDWNFDRPRVWFRAGRTRPYKICKRTNFRQCLYLAATIGVVLFVVVLVIWFIRIHAAEILKQQRNQFVDLPPGDPIPIPSTNITIEELLNTLDFPNRVRDMDPTFDRRVYDPYWVETHPVNTSRWTRKNKLKIFVVLFSHNDAGWQKTFWEYYFDQTEQILNNVLSYLTKNPQLKFIWTEISFFDMWWKHLNTTSQDAVKRLVKNKQLEFTGDGWVMPDEATVHYASYLTQLFEGHQWLKQHLDYIPRNGWAIDPFGLSPSLAFLLRQSGVKNKVLARIHYILRKYFREGENLEFYWRQQFDSEGSADTFAYLLPYASYDAGVTCGPAGRSVCLSFGSEFNNLTEASFNFLEQYRQTSMLFKTNNLLLPLGGDFSWKDEDEWTGLLDNFQRIMNYLNSEPELFTEIKFATLNEYFEAVYEEVDTGVFEPTSVSGDFFAYSNEHFDYWTGYYTSRAFHKVTERQLMSLLRSAQLAYTLTTAQIYKDFKNLNFPFLHHLITKLSSSRRSLSLFQHHDAIAGTSRDKVVTDYAMTIFQAMRDCHFILQQCLFYLNNHQKLSSSELSQIDVSAQFSEPVIHKELYNETWKYKVYTLNESYPIDFITVFNPLEYRRIQLIKLIVTSPNITVLDAESGGEIESEIYPVLENLLSEQYSDFIPPPGYTYTPMRRRRGSESEVPDRSTDHRTFYGHGSIFELNFVAELSPLQVKNFKLFYYPEKAQNRKFPRVRVLHANLHYQNNFGDIFHPEGVRPTVLSIDNRYVTLKLDKAGLVDTVRLSGGVPHKFNIRFEKYDSDWHGGLYSFSPSGPAAPVSRQPGVLVVEGELKSYVELWYVNVRHRITLLNHTGVDAHAIHVENTVDVRKTLDFELAMRVMTNIGSNNTFYTDSNGYQMMRRKFRNNVPLQGNFYPVASSTFIEDETLRMTILAAQPSGATSYQSGQLELIQDRRVKSDDGHGCGQGYLDNLVTVTRYKIILESLPESNGSKPTHSVPVLSLMAHQLLQSLLYEPHVFKSVPGTGGIRNFDVQYSGYNPSHGGGLACDVQLVSALPFLPADEVVKIRMTTSNSSVPMKLCSEVALLFHRVAFDGRFGIEGHERTCNVTTMGKLKVADLFGKLFSRKMKRMAVSFVNDFDAVWYRDDQVFVAPMDVYGLKASFVNK